MVGHVLHSGNVSERHHTTVPFDLNSASTVGRLLTAASPAAVLRGVWPIVVDTIQGGSNWPFLAHIVHKRIKTVQPPLADRDATSAVIGKRGVLLVVAAGFDAHVCHIQRVSRMPDSC